MCVCVCACVCVCVCARRLGLGRPPLHERAPGRVVHACPQVPARRAHDADGAVLVVLAEGGAPARPAEPHPAPVRAHGLHGRCRRHVQRRAAGREPPHGTQVSRRLPHGLMRLHIVGGGPLAVLHGNILRENKATNYLRHAQLPVQVVF